MNQKVSKKRVYIAGLFILIVSVLFIVKLFHLHFSSRIVVPDEKAPEIRRGYIKDRNGYILAMSIEQDSLFANPQEIEKPEETAQVLSGILNMPAERILRRLERNKRFVWIKRKLDDGTAGKIRELGRKGLYFRREYQRVYPHGSLASNIIGFAGVDNNGLAGIEYSCNSLLASTDRPGANGGIVEGKDIILTIDRYIQYISENEIQRAVLDHRAQQGAVLVLDIKTGRVLALAKFPSFDPNYYYRYSAQDRKNFTVTDYFEPGSTMKIIALSAMLMYKPGVTKQAYHCPGKIDIADVTINCPEVHGTIGMTDVIRHSCNVGIIEAMKGISKKNLFDTLTRFGFGRKIGVGLPAEKDGILRDYREWSGLSKYSMAIGHEFSVTSLQLAAAFGAIGNRGIYVYPAVIERIEDPAGEDAGGYEPRVRGRVLPEGIAAKLLKMMRGVVESGTGVQAASAYYRVVGKTGTSKKYVRGKGYTDRVLSSFVGLAPFESPDVCILVVVDDPADRLSGGKAAAPVFSRIIDRILIRKGVARQRIAARPPLHINTEGTAFDGKTMPDFKGLRLPESVRIMMEIKEGWGIDFSVYGTGRVYAQKPDPGTRLTGREKILLRFAGE